MSDPYDKGWKQAIIDYTEEPLTNLCTAIGLFGNDPPYSDYTNGYLAGLVQLLTNEIKKWEMEGWRAI